MSPFSNSEPDHGVDGGAGADARESKTAQRMNRPVSSRMSAHFSARVSSIFSSSVSDKFGGGNTFTRPSSSSYRRVFTSTLASGQSFFARRASTVSFSSKMSRSVLAWLSTAGYLLDGFDERCRPAQLPLGDFSAHARLPVVSGLPDSKSRDQIVAEDLGIDFLLTDQFLIESGMQALMAPFCAYKAFGLKGDLTSLEHGVVGPARRGIH
jgi:hypothetical protein